MGRVRVTVAAAVALVALAACGGTDFRTAAANHFATSAHVGPFVPDPSRPPNDPANANSHWHAALGVYDCDHWMGDEAPGVWVWPGTTNEGIFRAGTTTYAGLHSHDDGIIHMEPASQDEAGANATLGRYFDYGGWNLSADGFTFLGTTRNNGDDCGGQPGMVRWWVNGREHTGDAAKYKLMDHDVIVVAFVPSTAPSPGLPPSVQNLPGGPRRVGNAAGTVSRA